MCVCVGTECRVVAHVNINQSARGARRREEEREDNARKEMRTKTKKLMR